MSGCPFGNVMLNDVRALRAGCSHVSGPNFGVGLPSAANFVDGISSITNIPAVTIKVYLMVTDLFDYGTSFPAFAPIRSGKTLSSLLDTLGLGRVAGAG